MEPSPRITGSRPSRWVAALGLLLACALAAPARAGTTISLFKSFAGNINFVTTGGTRRTSSNYANGGNNTCNITGTATNTNMTVSGIPVGSTIVAAYLYYAASGNTTDSAVTFNGTNVTADRTFTDNSNGLGNYFSGFKDVTALVPGNGTYTFSNLTVSNGAPWCNSSAVLGAYALLVIYSNASTEPTRVINIYDGFQFFQNDSIAITTPANGFQIPSTGIDGKFAVITWEGDPDIPGGEVLQFNGNNLTDTCDPSGNQYNSTINTITCTTNEATNGGIYWGLDFDTYDVSSFLSAGQTQATTNYASGQDLVFLSAQIISVVNTPVADLSIAKTHSGTFAYGSNGSYSLTVTNNGPNSAAAASTVTVKDTLPAGETFVSASGTGWTCGNVSGTVTCTNPDTSGLAVGASLPAITLTVNVSTSAGASITNTATVSSAQFDNNSTNNSSSDTVSPSSPDLSNSTKSVFTVGGGDAVVGSTLQYTITVTESAGLPASGVSVTDDIPANLSNFAVVSIPSGATNSSTGTGGANGDGFLNITGISVPANGSVSIVFTAKVASGTANCATINNTATVNNPDGPAAPGGTPSSQTVTVAQSSCVSSRNKILYVNDDQSLTRLIQTANDGANAGVEVDNNTTATWTMSPLVPTVPAGTTLVLAAGTVNVQLIIRNINNSTGSRRNTRVRLLNNGAVVATSGTVTTGNNANDNLETYSLTLATPITVAAGTALGLEVDNTTTNNNRDMLVKQKVATLTPTSLISFTAATVINVDSVTAYTSNYPGTTLPPSGVFLPGQTVFVCAVVSDPFGSADTDPAVGGTAPAITITDPNGTVQVSGVAMTKETGTDCSGATTVGTTTASEAYEYTLTTSSSSPTGFWNAAVTASEGQEGVVTNTSNSAFDIDVPSLLVMKTVLMSTDPVEGATRAKAIPGATTQYAIMVQNNGRGPVDAGSLVIADAVPANTVMSLPAKPPFTFTDGGTASGVSVTAGSDANIAYSNNGGASYAYTPACTRPCTDTAITNFKITLNGGMNGKIGAGTPSFTITFNVVIK